MTVSLFSRFQGCLLMTFVATGESVPGETAIAANLESWSRIFHRQPYLCPLPPTVWQDDHLHWPRITDFCGWLVVLALWHHENPAGFKEDLGHSVTRFNQQFGDRRLPRLDDLDQAWIQLWQRLLTLILSERFTLAQLPDLWRSPFFDAPLGLPDPIRHHCQRDLTAIATALHHYQTPVFAQSPESPPSFAQVLPWAIYHWAATPAQPQLSLHQSQANPSADRMVPFTAALTGAYNGEQIIRPALTPSPLSQTALMSLINQFSQRHFLQWSGNPSASSEFSPLTSAAPLVMQRRSGLKLISQLDYEQFS